MQYGRVLSAGVPRENTCHTQAVEGLHAAIRTCIVQQYGSSAARSVRRGSISKKLQMAWRYARNPVCPARHGLHASRLLTVSNLLWVLIAPHETSACPCHITQ